MGSTHSLSCLRLLCMSLFGQGSSSMKRQRVCLPLPRSKETVAKMESAEEEDKRISALV